MPLISKSDTMCKIMKFSIITPTYKRADLLSRTLRSVLNQTYPDFEIIIVNDSPDDSTYNEFKKNISDSRIKYFKNEKNLGVNYSRNFAMDNISNDSDFIIFLDDDDWFATDTLSEFNKLIISKPNQKWFITNRAYTDGKLVTKYPEPEKFYSYIYDVLILKRCKGDVTHCIKTSMIKNIRYSKYVKQGEEWIFYYQISLKEKMFYHNHNSTLTDGYNKTSGLNFRKRTKTEQLKTIFNFIKEGHKLNLLHSQTFIIYLFMRFVRLCVKN